MPQETKEKSDKGKSRFDHPVLLFFFSLSAFVISLAGGCVSFWSYKITQRQFIQDRLLLLKAEIGGINDEFKELTINPINEDAHFLEGEAYFPIKLSEKVNEIQANGKVWGMGSFQFNLKNYLKNRFKSDADHVTVGAINLPIILKSYYASKGDTYTDVSLYNMRMQFVVASDDVKLYLLALSYVRRATPEAPILQNDLNDIFDNEKATYLPYRFPN